VQIHAPCHTAGLSPTDTPPSQRHARIHQTCISKTLWMALIVVSRSCTSVCKCSLQHQRVCCTCLIIAMSCVQQAAAVDIARLLCWLVSAGMQ
jgi:hypothetical protein